MGLDGAIHGANGPAGPSRPTSDRFPVTDRRAWRLSKRNLKEGRLRRVPLCFGMSKRSARPAVAFDLLLSIPWRAAQETVRGRAGWVRGTVGAMDGAIEPQDGFTACPANPPRPAQPMKPALCATNHPATRGSAVGRTPRDKPAHVRNPGERRTMEISGGPLRRPSRFPLQGFPMAARKSSAPSSKSPPAPANRWAWRRPPSCATSGRSARC